MSPYASSGLPGNSAGSTIVPLFGLTPGGACPATECCHPCGALLPHHFTLTSPCGLRRYIFCGAFHRLTPPRRYLAPCPMEPGLSSVLAQSGCLADSVGDYTYYGVISSGNKGWGHTIIERAPATYRACPCHRKDRSVCHGRDRSCRRYRRRPLQTRLPSWTSPLDLSRRERGKHGVWL